MADLFAPELTVQEVLTEFGVDGTIARAFRNQPDKRLALLRIHHAAENAQSAVDWVADVIAFYIANPASYREEMVENAKTLAAKLKVLANELEKSLPVAALREGEHLAETTENRGLRQPNRPAVGKAGASGPAASARGDDWGDVPF